MRTQVIAHAALLVVGATLAYLAWNKADPSGKDEAVVLAALDPKDLERVQLVWPEGEMTVTPVRDGDETTFASTLSYDEEQKVEKPKDDDKEPKEAPVDADAGPAEAEPAPKKVRVTSSFPGGRSVSRALETLAPLTARRNLGPVPADRLEAMGLATPERKLVVTAKGGKTWTFDVGASTYGDQGRYAKLQGSDDVLLLDSAAVRGLEGTPVRLMEARLVTVESEHVTAMKLTSERRQATFTHADRDQPKKRHFTLKDAPEQRSEEADGLFSTLRGLRSAKYVDKSALLGASVKASVTLERAQGKPLVVTLYEVEGGSDFLVQAGPWIGEVAAARGKNLLDDITAALPAE